MKWYYLQMKGDLIMKRLIALCTLVVLLFTQTTLINVKAETDTLSVADSNIFFEYWNELSTVERGNLIELSIECFKQYSEDSKFEVFIKDLFRGFKDAGVISTVDLEPFEKLATAQGQDDFRAAFENARTGGLNADTFNLIIDELTSKELMAPSLKVFFKSKFLKILNVFVTLETPLFYMDNNVVTTISDIDYINDMLKVAFEQADIDKFNLSSITAKFADFLNEQVDTIKTPLSGFLSEFNLVTETEPVPKDDLYAKYNKLDETMKLLYSATLRYYVIDDEFYDAVKAYYDIAAAVNEENLPNSFGFTPAELLELIENLRKESNSAAVDALFEVFPTMDEASVFARIDQAAENGLFSERIKSAFKIFFPFINVYCRLELPIFDEKDGMVAEVNDNVDKLHDIYKLVLVPDAFPDSTFRGLAEKLAAGYNSLSFKLEKTFLREALVYFSFMNSETQAPVATFKPANNASNVKLSSVIQVKFDEPVFPTESDFDDCFELLKGKKKAKFTVLADDTLTVFTLVPKRLFADQKYTVKIKDGALSDIAGNLASGSATWRTVKMLTKDVKIKSYAKKNKAFLSPGGSNKLKLQGKANDAAKYKLVYKTKKGKWKTVYTKKVTKPGKFAIKWNGKIKKKYLKARKKPYNFRLQMVYNGKTKTIKKFKLKVQKAPKVKVNVNSVFNTKKAKKLNVNIKWNAVTNLKVGVYNAKGKLVKLLFNKNDRPGRKINVSWNGKNAKNKKVKPGIYYIKVVAGKTKVSEKVVVIRDQFKGK